MTRRRSLIGALSLRFALVAVLAVTLSILAHLLVNPVELHYELDDLAADLARRVEERTEGRRAVEPDDELRERLAAVPGLRLVVLAPGRAEPLLAWGGVPGSGHGDDDLDEDLEEMLDWPEGHFELLRPPGHEHGASGYGYIRAVAAADGLPLRIVALRGPPERRDLFRWAWRELLVELGPFLALGMLAAVGVGILTIAETLRPLQRLSAQALAIVPGQTAARLDERPVPREILPLVQAVNRALDRLQQAFDQQRRFTADAAHELRTPLAAIQARLEGLPSGPERTALERSVARMSRLVEQLLAVARLESGQLRLDEVIDLARVARRAIAERAPLAIRAGRTIELETPAVPVRRRGNAAAVEQAVGNLLDNALRFAPEGTRVEVEVTQEGEVRVLDRGPGLDGADAAWLFEPFTRAPERRRSEGAGLGLAIVREVAERHGGEAYARERDGGGAVFGIRLPVVPST